MGNELNGVEISIIIVLGIVVLIGVYAIADNANDYTITKNLYTDLDQYGGTIYLDEDTLVSSHSSLVDWYIPPEAKVIDCGDMIYTTHIASSPSSASTYANMYIMKSHIMYVFVNNPA